MLRGFRARLIYGIAKVKGQDRANPMSQRRALMRAQGLPRKRLRIPYDCEKPRATGIAPMADINACGAFVSARPMARFSSTAKNQMKRALREVGCSAPPPKSTVGMWSGSGHCPALICP